MAFHLGLFPPPKGLLQVLPAWPEWDEFAFEPRKQKSELKKGKEAPKASRRKTVKKEPEEIRHVVQVLGSPHHAQVLG